MASEDTGEAAGVTVSEDVRGWLRRRADEHGVDVDRFVRELLAAHRNLDVTGGNDDADDTDLDAFGAADQEALDDLRSEFQQLIEDVRSRVVQVKREVDGKAPVDHEHGVLEADIDELQSELATLDEELRTHRDRLGDLETSVEDGFDNFEDVLEHLLETTDDLADRTDRLARATIGTRERLDELAGAMEERRAVDRLKRDAALEGISTADCGDCGQSVRAALLTSPNCPYCATSFVDVEPKRGFLGSATWVPGDPPVLTRSDEDTVAEELQADVERDRPDSADVDWDSAGDEDA